MRGFWADERVDGKIWNLKNPLFRLLYQYFKKKEITFLSNADYTVSLTENAKKIIGQWKSISNQPIPIKVIPCCADTELFNPENIDANARKELQHTLAINDSDYI